MRTSVQGVACPKSQIVDECFVSFVRLRALADDTIAMVREVEFSLDLAAGYRLP
jgi:hypothetical protein